MKIVHIALLLLLIGVASSIVIFAVKYVQKKWRQDEIKEIKEIKVEEITSGSKVEQENIQRDTGQHKDISNVEIAQKGGGEQDTTGSEEREKEKSCEPIDRGGRARSKKEDNKKKKQPESKTKSPCLKPEIICWKKERQWIPAVEIPEDVLKNSVLSIVQNTSPLAQDKSRKDCWHLEQLRDHVVVRQNEDGTDKETNIAVGEEKYLLFKLGGQNQNQGRHVKTVSSGSYLVMVPDNWRRNEELSGPAPVAPEPVSIDGYRAHFYTIEKDDGGKVAFLTSEGESIVIEPKTPRFDLVGAQLNDASEEMGPLFAQRPPQIRTLGPEGWKDVKTIVVGEEGPGKGRWRTAFSLSQGLQDLPSELKSRKGGWYFLRFYDANDDLIESVDFRFHFILKDIRVHQSSSLPSSNGHESVHVEFLYDPDCVVSPADDLERSIQIISVNNKTILTIPPVPIYDKTFWLVGHKDGPKVEVAILVERLWWTVGEENIMPTEWGDKLVILRCDEFAAASKKALWLRIPRRRWIDRIHVGFEQSKARPYSVKVMEKTVVIPFREFCDTQEVEDSTQEHHLKVWIKGDNGLGECIIGVIPADKQKSQNGKRSFPNFALISAPRLATAITHLRRATRGPLRLLIKEIRREFIKGHAISQTESLDFVKKALCVIALFLELERESQSQILSLKNHWIIKARAASDKFPEVMNLLRDRYKELNSCRVHGAGRRYDTGVRK